MSEIELIATSTFGLEGIVAEEVEKLGYSDVRIENGRVVYTADEIGIARSNLWLRCAERVFIKIGEFDAEDFDELFDKTKALPWHEWLPGDAEFPVTGKSVKSKLHSVPTCQSIVKKAIVEEMREHYGIQWFEEDGPLYPIQFSLYKDTATLTIDTSGTGLHRRGYRDLSSTAPLKETLAAGLVHISDWTPDRYLIDPMCGSGTIPIEAAMIGANIAPGLNREFAAEKWPLLPDIFWEKAREEAREAIEWKDDYKRIMGYDKDEKVLSLARRHAKRAGVEEYTDFHPRDITDLDTSNMYGYVISNPPYGERLSNKHEVKELYDQMGKAMVRMGRGTWSFNVLTSYRDFEDAFGTLANKKRKLYNGRLRVDFYQYFAPDPPSRD